MELIELLNALLRLFSIREQAKQPWSDQGNNPIDAFKDLKLAPERISETALGKDLCCCCVVAKQI